MTLPSTIGIFGLGLIGTALSKRLIAAGVDLCGYDPDPAGMERLKQLGGRAVTAAQVWQSPCVISAVFDTAQLADLAAGSPQDAGCTIISFSTCDPAQMPEIAKAVSARGNTLIEAPISGTSADLAAGDAILLVAGDRAVADGLEPLFNAVSRAHYHVGDVGNGNRAKLAINLTLGLTRAAIAEGFVFAKSVGLKPDDFLTLALDSAAASKAMASKGPKMATGDFAPLGRIAQSGKDFALILEQAALAGQGLPMAEQYLDLIADNIAQGEGDLDNAAILLAIARAKPSKA
jgi:3-hydroxyisobutyrate dehydrogenase-like beta-hydroxyacid dehydrogenase